MKKTIACALLGLALGTTLTFSGFADYREVHAMFTLRDPRLWLTFAGAVAISVVGFAILARKASLPRRSIHASTIAGAALFGAGWAITGACPGVVFVQIAQGYLPALATFGGVIAGVQACRWARSKWGWTSDSC